MPPELAGWKPAPQSRRIRAPDQTGGMAPTRTDRCKKLGCAPSLPVQFRFLHSVWLPCQAGGSGILACQFTGHPWPVFLLPPRRTWAVGTGGRMPPELAGWKPAPQRKGTAHAGTKVKAQSSKVRENAETNATASRCRRENHRSDLTPAPCRRRVERSSRQHPVRQAFGGASPRGRRGDQFAEARDGFINFHAEESAGARLDFDLTFRE